MTLRLRLTLALGALLVVGLVVFGVGLTASYARSQYARLDDRLRSSAPFMEIQLFQSVDPQASRPGPGGGGGGGGGGGPPVVVPLGTYAELRDADGDVVTSIVQGTELESTPDVPDDLPEPGSITTIGSVDGGTHWRMLVSGQGPSGFTSIVASPTDDVTDSLRRLIVIELAAGAVILAALTTSTWLILRRGLRPLETMAGAAKRISGGDLSPRVDPADTRSEVGQLGLALNSMLDEIEAAFGERDATEQRLRQFLTDASHELRTPLTSIQGFTELFRLRTTAAAGNGSEGAGDIDLPVVLRRIEQEAMRMRLLVDDLLLLARLDETRPAERVPVDLAIVAADACTDAAATDATGGPGRRITLDAPLPVVVAGDDAHLRQAVGNLVGNALRHTPPGTPVDVAVSLDGGRAVLTVADRGPGLPPGGAEHVFDRFWQADAARAGQGAGLGLAIVAGIAHEHDGVAIAADRPGGGAVFTLVVPLDAGVGSGRPSATSG